MPLLRVNDCVVSCGRPDEDVQPISEEVEKTARTPQSEITCDKNRFTCPDSGCEARFPYPSNLFAHIKKAHSLDLELLKVAEQETSSEHSNGAVVACVACGAVRHGKAVLRHFEICHSDLEKYSLLYKEVKAQYFAASRQSRLQARRERNQQIRQLKREALGAQIESIKSISSSDLISSFCLFCCTSNFTCAQEIAEHVKKEHGLLWAEYHQMTLDYGCLIQLSVLSGYLENKYTLDFCGLCGKRLSKPSISIARHIKVHNLKKAEYHRLLLKDCASRKEYFTQHRYVKNFSCPLCTAGFTMMNNLCAHVRSKHKNSPDAHLHMEDMQASLRQGLVSVQCLVCGKNRSGTSVVSHMRITHSHIQDFENLLQQTLKILQRARRQNAKRTPKQAFACRHCDQQFRSRTSRLRHQISCSSNAHRKQIIRCKKCSYWTQDSMRLDSHTKRRHSVLRLNEETHVCHLCGKTYKRSSSLLVHLGCVHGVTKKGPARTYVCPYCGKIFVYNKRYYNAHVATHSVERRFVCSLCNNTFKTSDGLRTHVRTFHENTFPFYCERCGHGVQNKRHLENHICGRVRRQQQTAIKAPAVVDNSSLMDLLTDHVDITDACSRVVIPDMEQYAVPDNSYQHYTLPDY